MKKTYVRALAIATDCTSRATCFAFLAGDARMCTSVGRPTWSVTLGAALTSGSRHSSRSRSVRSGVRSESTAGTVANRNRRERDHRTHSARITRV